MRARFLIDYGDCRTPALLHDIRTRLHSHSRSGWQMREEDLADAEPQGRLTLLTISFDDPRDAEDFTHWRDIDRWAECL